MKNKLKVSLKHVNDVRVKLGLDPHEAPIVKKEIKVKETFIEETEVEKDEFEETYKQMSPFKLILRRFFRSRLSVVGLVMLVFLFAFSFLGPLVYSKWGETEVEFTDKEGKTRTTWGITVEDVEFPLVKGKSDSGSTVPSEATPTAANDGDLPF